MMDETGLRTVVREEITLAVSTLAKEMYSSDPDSDGYSFEQAASSFDIYAYRGACEAADEQRARDAADPFAEPEGEVFTVEVKALVQAEVLAVLKEMQSTFYGSGLASDYSIAERLENIIRARTQ